MTHKRKILLQYAAAISGSITTVGWSSMLGWSSPAIPYLTGKNSEIPLSTTESFWMVPLFNISCTMGFILNPAINNKFSTKNTLLIYSVPQMISWLLIVLAKNYVTIYLGLALGGISYGAGSCAIAVYLSEIGNQDNRGIFLVLTKLSLTIGHFFTMMLGAYFSYNSMNIMLLMTPIIFFCTFVFVPDSLYFRDQNQKCEQGKTVNPVEIKMISRNLSESKKSKDEFGLNKLDDLKLKSKSELKEIKLWNLFNRLNNRRALVVIILCMSQNIFSGNIIMRSYGQKIMTYEGAILRPEKATFLLSGLSIISSLLSTVIVEKFKRRTLLLFFGILGSLSQGIVGLFFFLKYYDFNVTAINWLPLFGLVTYDFSLTNGCINVYLIYQGELFPSDVKTVAITFTKVLLMTMISVAAILFQLLAKTLDKFVIFWIFASVCGFLSFFIFHLAPESKGKSLEEIQVMLKSRRV